MCDFDFTERLVVSCCLLEALAIALIYSNITSSSASNITQHRAHEPAVLKSFSWFATTAARELVSEFLLLLLS